MLCSPACASIGLSTILCRPHIFASLSSTSTWNPHDSSVKVIVHRHDPYAPDPTKKSFVSTYVVDTKHPGAGPMLLDALMHIKATTDPTLSFRKSCREGVCGSCAVNIKFLFQMCCTFTLLAELMAWLVRLVLQIVLRMAKLF